MCEVADKGMYWSMADLIGMSRVSDRIQNLKPDEIGYQKIISLKMNGRTQKL